MDELDNIEITEEVKIRLRERQGELVKLVSALNSLEKSEEWSVLKELLFSKALANIERQLLIESLSAEVNTNKIYRLQGEWAWAKQYNDTDKFAETLKKQLEDIKKRLK